MRLKYQFETMELEDQVVAVPVGNNSNEFHGVVKLNETSAHIFELLKEETTEEAIVNKMMDIYDAPKDTLSADVKKFVEELSERGLLDS